MLALTGSCRTYSFRHSDDLLALDRKGIQVLRDCSVSYQQVHQTAKDKLARLLEALTFWST